MRGLRRQLPLALVLVLLAGGLLAIAGDHWRRGCVIVACSLLLAGGARLVLPGSRAGLLATAGDHWRRGCVIVACSLMLAGGARLVLPGSRAGLLAVRSRAVDVSCALLLGGAVLVLAWIVPSSN